MDFFHKFEFYLKLTVFNVDTAIFFLYGFYNVTTLEIFKQKNQ